MAYGLRSKFVGGMQDPVYPSFLCSTNHGLGHADAGNSFLALLYGPPSLSHADFQELSGSKPCTPPGNFTAASGNFAVNSVRSGTFLTSCGGLITENLSNHNLQTQEDTFLDISSCAMMGLSSGNDSVFHNIQSRNNAAQPVPGDEKTREPLSFKGQFCGTSPLSNLNVCSSDIQAMPNMALEWCSSKWATPFMSGCPRVVCLGKSGYLLLSNTGLLGIVCSCHCCHMSVLKFCEHSGLHGTNPGDAVRMESGETIAQWRKLYFLKFGIRSTGNESDWDWPEVLSATGSLMKSNASSSKMLKSDLSHLFGSTAVSIRSGNPSDYVILPSNAHTDHNLSTGALLRKQQMTIQDGSNIPLKGFTGVSQNNLNDKSNSRLMATYTTAPNIVGTRQADGCELMPPVLDSQKRNENLSLAHSASQTPFSFLKDHEFIINKNAKDGLRSRESRDATSSNIELRLGQPRQTGNPVLSVVEPLLFDALVSPPKLQPLKDMTHNNNADLSRQGELQHNFSFAAGPFNSKIDDNEAQPYLELRNYMSGINNALGASGARLETHNVTKGLACSAFTQINPQPEGSTKASEILVNNGVPIIPRTLHSGFSSTQFDPTYVFWSHNGCIERELYNSAPSSNKLLDSDKGVHGAKDYCTKRNTSVGANLLCDFKRVSPLGQDSHVAMGSLGTQLFSAPAIPSEVISKGFPFLVSSSTSNQTSTLLQHQQGINTETYFPDENMRLLALRQMLELSEQQRSFYLNEINQKQGRPSNISKGQHCIYQAPTSEHGTSGATLKWPQNRGTCGNHEITGDLQELASLKGLNRCCHVSGLAPIQILPKEKESQRKHSSDLRNEEPSLSLGRKKNNTGSSACEKCSGQPSDAMLIGKYTCSAHVCSGSNFFSQIGPCPCACKQQFANASDEASLITASKFSRDQNASKDENIHFQLGGKSDGQDSSKFGSDTPQWRDVPNKIRKVVSGATSPEQTAIISNWEGQDGDQVVGVSAKRFKATIHAEKFLNEQENSNVSSGCCAPVVTQSSVEVNNVDSCTVGAIDTGYVDNLVLDEGSGIEKGWLSDTLESERSAECLGSTCETYSGNDCLRILNDQPHRSLLDELKLLDSLTWKKGRDQDHRADQSQNVKGFKGKKRKTMEVRKLDTSFASGIPSLPQNEINKIIGGDISPSNLSKEMQIYFSSIQRRSSGKASFLQQNTEQRNSAFPSKFRSCKGHLCNNQSDKEDSCELDSNSDCEFQSLTGVSGRRKSRKVFSSDSFMHFQIQGPAGEEPENTKLKPLFSKQANPHKITKPVVCGDFGEISGGESAGELPKPAKIVPLSEVLKTSKRCRVPKNSKQKLTSIRKWKQMRSEANIEHCYGNSGWKTKEENETQSKRICDGANVVSIEDLRRGKKPHVTCKVKLDTKADKVDSILDSAHAPVKLKTKEFQKQRSIYELTARDTKLKEILEHTEDGKHRLCDTNCRKSVQHMGVSILNSEAFCCVCRSSSNDVIDRLLECSSCLIRVHQACYGISASPKGRWCCRPCRTNSKNIACVLCGYGGGAMTRALQSPTIVKSLLKVWNIEKDGMPKLTTPHEVFKKDMDAFFSSTSRLEGDQKCVSRPENIETLSTDLLKVAMSANHMQETLRSVGNFKVHNSITAGVLDATVKQWVHMVCGLWTPGTRCPNVNTMGAFDVSGVSRPRADVVCSICNRWGGSCIKCRVSDCSVKFHPWCAHQKNLLLSETEGVDDEKIGFYGRCVLHAIDPINQSKHDPVDNKGGSLEIKGITCARTEGYKGRGRDGFQHNCYSALKGVGGCLVPEEQLNAWIHINGQKLCSLGLAKIPASDIEYDGRKEYARYKQAKGWKHLLVYKSGIHALGLYTSRFISRGQMVVEYVGEVVGLRVADKREIEYQSGRKLQYKSACYFFRIDKEYIIDATRKGGIARFVNHSCLPNCVAKVITVRHEKKVVFFAERDIFPGEEITYDYHFNHEDEGKKIPCYCNAKNCRRYLN